MPSWISSFWKVDEAWDATLHTLEGHRRRINHLAYSPDLRQLAAVTTESVRIWSTRTGVLLNTFEDRNRNYITALDFSQDGEQLACTSNVLDITIWDTASGAALHVLKGHLGHIWGIQYSPNRVELASASHDGSIVRWDLASGSSLGTFKRQGESLRTVVYLPRGQRLFSYSYDGKLLVWDIVDDSESLVMECEPELDFPICSPDDEKFAGWNLRSEQILIYSIFTGLAIDVIDVKKFQLQGISIQPPSSFMAFNQHQIQNLRTINTHSVNDFEGHGNRITTLSFLLREGLPPSDL